MGFSRTHRGIEVALESLFSEAARAVYVRTPRFTVQFTNRQAITTEIRPQGRRDIGDVVVRMPEKWPQARVPVEKVYAVIDVAIDRVLDTVAKAAAIAGVRKRACVPDVHPGRLSPMCPGILPALDHCAKTLGYEQKKVRQAYAEHCAQFLGHRLFTVRLGAVHAVAEAGRDEFAHHLKVATTDSSFQIRRAAMYWLALIGTLECVDVMIEAVGSEDLSAAANAVKGLARLGVREAVPVIADKLGEITRAKLTGLTISMADATFDALRLLADERAVPALEDAIEWSAGANLILLRTLLAAFAAIGTPACIPGLYRLTQIADRALAKPAQSVLAQIGSDDATAALAASSLANLA